MPEPLTPEREARIRARHQPVSEEAEIWADSDVEHHAELFPDCTDCEGHTVPMQVCRECGYDHDGDQPVYREWPCPTSTDIADLLAENERLQAALDTHIAVGRELLDIALAGDGA